jgi:hypothetical protein
VTERLACRMDDTGCTATKQISDLGGQLDNTLSTYGVLALVAFADAIAATTVSAAWLSG